MEKNIEAFKDYLLLEKGYSLLTVQAYKNDVMLFETYLREQHDGVLLEKAFYGQIRNWIVFLSEKGLSNRSINRKLASLKAFYKFLLKIRVLTVSPLIKHRSLKTPKKMQLAFSQRELQEITQVEFDKDFEGVRDKLMIELFYATGIRRAELINLKVSNIDFSLRTIKVLGKRNKERVLPLLEELVGQIEEYLTYRSSLEGVDDEEYLFLTNKGNKLYPTLVYRVINDYLSLVTRKTKKSPHILRHSFATHLLNNGADLNAVKELLGHSSLASTQVYVESSLSELKRTYNRTHPRTKKEL